jgi:hypothetical protein
MDAIGEAVEDHEVVGGIAGPIEFSPTGTEVANESRGR